MSDILQQIVTKLDDLSFEIKELRGSTATKEELAEIKMTTREELAEIKKTMATKEELAEIKKTMATKDELAEIKKAMATKEELTEIKKTMATKDEVNEIKITMNDIKGTLADMDSRLEKVHEQVVRNSELISMKADKEDVININKRLDLHLVRISKLEEEVTLIKQAK